MLFTDMVDIYEYPSDMSVGIIAMSAKPIHAGHYSLIEQSAAENDETLLYVSLKDRRRKGEIPIMGDDMRRIWKTIIERHIPASVTVQYVDSPISAIYEQLGHENERLLTGDEDVATYTIYSDPHDLATRFNEKYMTKYVGELYHSGRVKLVPISREDNIDISGTKMRRFIATGDEDAFKMYLPDPLSDTDRDEIWNMLRARIER